MLLEEYTCPSTGVRLSLLDSAVGGFTVWRNTVFQNFTDESTARNAYTAEVRLLKDAAIEKFYSYLPGGENQMTFEGGGYTAPQCPPHVPIEVGFRHSKIVCKICDKELTSEAV